ncbi:MAG: diguanylate cyclase [Pseudomonadota bacterium]
MTGRILIIAPPARTAALQSRLREAFLDPVAVADPQEAARRLGAGEADLVLAEPQVTPNPRPARNGGPILEDLLRAAGDDRRAPFLLMLPAEASAARLSALRAGVDGVVAPDAPEEELLARIGALLRGRAMSEELRLRERTAASLGLPAPEDPPRRAGGLILHMPAGGAARRRAAHLAAALNLRVRPIEDGREALAAAAEDPPELMVVAPPADQTAAALRLVAALRAQRTLGGAGLVAILPRPADAARALDLGADDALDARATEAELALRLGAQLRRARWADRLRRIEHDGFALAATDALTGLWNRRYALSHLSRLAAEAREADEPLSLLMIDLDRFKTINDVYGHAAGDAVLREFASRLREALRGADLAARLGGEEFCAALRGAGREAALDVAERLREATAGRPFTVPDLPKGIDVTVSIGVASTATSTSTSPLPMPTAAATPLRGFAEPAAPSLRGPKLERGGLNVDPALGRSLGAAEAEALLARADAALYESKSGGRNRVTATRAA